MAQTTTETTMQNTQQPAAVTIIKTIGVVLSDRVTTGLVFSDGTEPHRIQGELRTFPESEDDESSLIELHTEALIQTICEQVMLVAGPHKDIAAVGVAVPGIVRAGVVDDSPNIPQIKGARIAELLAEELAAQGLTCPVNVLNDADGVAAGLAASTGKLSSFVRVWTLGVGIGFGRYPFAEGVWEGGHTTVTLDDRENYCGCGGRGHIEGIMGHRAMRLRFLDMEPEEVFAEARKKLPRFPPLPRLRQAVAQGPRRRHRQLHPHVRPRKIPPHRLQCPLR